MSIVNFEHCGRYELREVLGEGAMGTVYRAWDPALARAVAIKVIQGWELSDDTVERFRREAQVLAKLPHPNIVGIFDVSMAGDDPFIVMELVEGRSLAALIKGGPVTPIEQQLRMMIQVCEALTCAHTAGVVHRDVKPGNILITPRRSAKLADFGIARLYDSTLTATSNVVGTPAYLAPEAFSGGPIDARTDIYGVAACLYEWASGSRLNDAGDLASLVAKVTRNEAPRLSAVWKDCPPLLDRCLQRGLARNPDDRYQRAVDFADDLGAVLKDLGASRHGTAPDVTDRLTPVPSARTQSPRTRIVAILAVVVVILVMWWALAPRDPAASLPSAEASSAPPAGRASQLSSAAAQPAPDRLPLLGNGNTSGVGGGNDPVSASDGNAVVTRRTNTTRGASDSSVPADSAAIPAAAPALEEDEDEPARRAVPIGTRVHVSLLTELRTDRTQPGHEFEGRLAEPLTVASEVIAAAGATLRGIVDEVSAGGGGRPPSLHLSLTELMVAGTPIRIRTARYEVVSPGDTGGGASRTTLILGTTAGALIGGAAGGTRGSVGGGALGAAAASNLRTAPRPGDIVLNNPLIFKLAEPLLLAAKPD